MLSQNIRKPARSGQFYPSAPKVLREDIETYLEQVDVAPLSGRIVGIIVPHAGYMYSGKIAAHAFKALRRQKIKEVLLVGPSHFVPFTGIAAYPDGAFRTPLGDVNINKSAVDELIETYHEVNSFPQAHIPEHSLEVELPFLQVTQKDFKIIPLLIRTGDSKDLSTLSQIMLSYMSTEQHIVIVSVDLSHFHSYDEAVLMDKSGLEPIVSLNPDLLVERLNNGETEIDAPGAVYALIKACREMNCVKGKLLKYANSGDISGDKTSVVGYSSIIFYL